MNYTTRYMTGCCQDLRPFNNCCCQPIMPTTFYNPCCRPQMCQRQNCNELLFFAIGYLLAQNCNNNC